MDSVPLTQQKFKAFRDRFLRLSLKYKLLLLLLVMPTFSLSAYLVLASQLFESDKIAYVYDASLSLARSLSAEVKAEIQSLSSRARPLAQTYSPEQKKFTPIANQLLLQDATLKWIGIFEPNSLAPSDSLKNNLPVEANPLIESAALLPLVRQARSNQVSVRVQLVSERNTSLVVLALASSDRTLVSVFEVRDFLTNFGNSGVYSSFWIDSNGSAVLGTNPGALSLESLLVEVKNKNTPRGTLEWSDKLVSFYQLEMGDGYVLSLVERRDALRAVDVLILKSVIFFIGIISFSTIISLLASNSLTASLRKLESATRQLSSGDFKVRIEVSSSDEVGKLAEGFNFMTNEIARLMEDNVHKARMEKELETARTVQETLFPTPYVRFTGAEIAGYYQPASECSGDWWHYSDLGDRILMWIGDATGHGAAAALITSAAKSAATVIEQMSGITPAVAMRHLNHAIYNTSRGNMNMTFFIACFDKSKGELTYCCASHDPPYLIRKKDSAYSKRDIKPLNDVNHTRLGEVSDMEYTEKTIQLQDGDVVVFYTDGIMDILNQTHSKWGKKQFIQQMLVAMTQEEFASDFLKSIVTSAQTFRSGAELIDDITMFVFRYKQDLIEGSQETDKTPAPEKAA